MHDDSDFLRKLLENPADDTVRLVYADWLEERDDPESRTKAQFLRLAVRLNEPKRSPRWRAARRKEMQPLAAKLPTDWLAVVSRLSIDYCGSKVEAANRFDFLRQQFEFVCDQDWAAMTPTGDAAVRLCEGCQQNVHYCGTITEARKQAERGHCVAVDLGIIRRENDLSPPVMMLGLPSLEFMNRERERLAVDDVSREREGRKRQSAGGESA
jgi:uncharacterized protein (TIGR02996 family)